MKQIIQARVNEIIDIAVMRNNYFKNFYSSEKPKIIFIGSGSKLISFINKFNLLAIDGRQYSICNNKLKENNIICKKCYGNIELLILNDKIIIF